MLEAFALIVLLVVTGVVIWLVVLIAGIPGKIARANNHPICEVYNLLPNWFLACGSPEKTRKCAGADALRASGRSHNIGP